MWPGRGLEGGSTDFMCFMTTCLNGLVMKSLDTVISWSPSLWQSCWWCTSVCSSVIPISIHHINVYVSVWMNARILSFLPLHCLLQPTPPAVLPPPPSTELPPHLSLGAVWGDGCGFCQWCLRGVYRLTASQAQSPAETYCFVLGTLEQDTDFCCCMSRSFGVSGPWRRLR